MTRLGKERHLCRFLLLKPEVIRSVGNLGVCALLWYQGEHNGTYRFCLITLILPVPRQRSDTSMCDILVVRVTN